MREPAEPAAPFPGRARPAAVFAALVLVQIFFGVHYLAAKIVLEEIPPRAWATMRVGAAALLLLVIVRASGRRLPTRAADLGRLALYSVFGVAVNQVCFVEGLSRTTPTHSSLINTTIPVATLVFAVLLGRERMALTKGLALLTAFTGVMLVLRPASADLSGSMLAGDLLTLVNAGSYSMFLVLSRRLLMRTDALGATTVLLCFGFLGIAAVGLPELLAFSPAQVSASVWGLGLFIVVFPTAGAYVLSYWALARAESSVVAFFIFLQPVIATTLSVLLLGERPGPYEIGGAALIFLGVILVLSSRSRRKRDPAG